MRCFTTAALTAALVCGSTLLARADHHQMCVAVSADVPANVMADVMKADSLYAHLDFDGAFALYARAHATSKDVSLLYAQGMAKLALGAKAEARGFFDAYLAAGAAGAMLAFGAEAKARLDELGGPLPAGGGLIGGVVGGVVGVTGGVVGGVPGGVGGVSGVGGVVGGVTAKPKKIAGTAAIVVGVVAIAALGAVGIHAIAAGIKDDISLDAKFDLGVGLSGVTLGITALYLSSLTVATGAVGGACGVVGSVPSGRPIVSPIAMPGGGGLAAALTF